MNVGVFASNRRRPIHRWYPFVEGYSAEIVDRAVLASGRPSSAIFDPFGGSGTTALAASMLGQPSAYTEVNPYLGWLGEVKVNQARAGTQDPSGLVQLTEFSSHIRDHCLTAGVSPDHPLIRIDERRQFFPNGVAAEVVAVLGAIDTEFSGWARDLARLAVATALVPASNMIRRTDLRRRTAGDRPPGILRQLVADKLMEVVEDTKDFAPQLLAPTRMIGTDARGPYKADEPFELVVTSPPYLNGTNYCRNSKLELIALGFIEREADLQSLRASSLTAGINNVSKRTRPAAVIAAVEAIAESVDVVAYDRRIGHMIRAYFSDMQAVLTTLHEQCAPGAELWLDIGDSRYSGVHVRTHDLLVDVARTVGWTLITTETLRERRSYDGGRLTQVLLRLAAE